MIFIIVILQVIMIIILRGLPPARLRADPLQDSRPRALVLLPLARHLRAPARDAGGSSCIYVDIDVLQIYIYQYMQYISLSLYIYIYIHICVYVCVYIYIYIYMLLSEGCRAAGAEADEGLGQPELLAHLGDERRATSDTSKCYYY